MDEISTCLDSSTTFQIVNSLKQWVHILKGTAAISLLQPAPETYYLFDDIILLSDSHVVNQCPRECVLEFFKATSFQCPERNDVADFLQEVETLNFAALSHSSTSRFDSGKSETAISKWARSRTMTAKMYQMKNNGPPIGPSTRVL